MRRMVKGMGWLTAVCCAVLCCASTFGQDLERFERQLERIRRETRLQIDQNIPLEQRTVWDAGAYVQFNFLTIDDIDQNTHILRQSSLNVYARANIDGVHQFFVRTQAVYNDFNTGDSFDGSGDDFVGPNLERAIYRFDFSRHQSIERGEDVPWHLAVQVGRQLVHWGNGLTLSEQVDGGIFEIGWENVRIDLLGGITRDSISDFDASRPDFSNDTQRGLFGAIATWQVDNNHAPYAYFLWQEDYNDDDPFVFGASTTNFEYSSYYFGLGSTGTLTQNLRYTVEAVYEGGEGKSNSFHNQTFIPIGQTDEEIHAWALDAIIDYVFGDENRTRLTGELLIASGDDDRLTTSDTFGGNQSGTDDNAFNSFGFVNTGLAFNTNVSNLIMVRGGASTFPFSPDEYLSRLQVGVDVFVFTKYDSDAPIDEPSTTNGYLGFETDFYATWQVTSDVTIALRYGIFLPGSGIVADEDARHFFFTGVTYGF